MKILPHVQNCDASTKMPKNWKNNFGNIFKKIIENWRKLVIFKNRCINVLFRTCKNIGRKNTMVMKILPHIQNYDGWIKMQKIEKIILGTFLKNIWK